VLAPRIAGLGSTDGCHASVVLFDEAGHDSFGVRNPSRDVQDQFRGNDRTDVKSHMLDAERLDIAPS
jgi:hypothetical protein